MLSLVEVLVFILTFLVSLLYLCNRSPKRFPPGPWGLPFVGYIPFLGHHPFKTFGKLGEKYGDVFSVPLGMDRVVVLNDGDDIRAAWKEEAFSGRPNSELYKAWASAGTDEKHGIIFSDGNDWMEQRRFALRHLKDFGFGRQSMESIIQHEVQLVCESLEEKAGTPVNIDRFFDLASLNSLWTIIASNRFEADDPNLHALLKNIMDTFLGAPVTGLLYHCPGILKIFPKFSGWDKMTSAVKNIHNFTREIIQEHKKTLQEGAPRDFIDVYLEEIKRTTDSNSSFYSEKGERYLMIDLLDFFVAGSETVGNTLMWFVLLLALYPDEQKKLQQKVDEVAGTDCRSSPGLHLRKSLCYLDAFISEVLRFSSFVPMGNIHTTTFDVEFKGYHIPKGTSVFSNLYHAMNDPRYWDHPEEFHPERFLNSEGQLKHNNAFLIFGSGKRSCLGEILAHIELFMFCSALVQKFSFSTVPGEAPPSLEPARVGVIIYLHPFRLMVTSRKDQNI